MPQDAPATVLVTGAGGFIGARVATELSGRGIHVRAGVRRRAASAAGIDRIGCDLDTPADIARAVAGADAVVHAAYGSDAAMVRQCADLLAEMTRAGVGNLVYFSSIAVYGEREGQISEASTPVGALGRYGEAKRACEALIGRWVGDAVPAPRRAVILRPGIVYGTGSRFWIDKLVERIDSGAWGTFGARGEGSAALVHVDDVAAITAAASLKLVSPERALLAPVEAVHLVGPETPTWNAYFAAVAERAGSEALGEIGSGGLVLRRAFGGAAKVWRRLGLPGGRAAALSPASGELALFARRARYADDRAAALFGVRPAIGLEDGLRLTDVRRRLVQDTSPRP